MSNPAIRATPSGTPPARDTQPALRSALSREQAEGTAALLRVVSDPTRLQILSLIHHSEEGRARVADLTRALGLRQPTVSHHLKVMNEASVLSRDPVGREVWYAIVPDRLDAIADLLR
ncbi:ArsR/SmtB family transcription factor [Myceligenerans xiligouense]|uniref:ArsR family transcriptional regulator n=1 Tax=Myceligenerans xiligouense TaxID=253184 RepID=A0A3N4ZUN9_9MICO|nr:metalloregulator ArsR/SmtB family transcription factor [Myceligenerans xiligouense]RPF23411.1 ArsR family transcriptional regulator [Myceligenerans xiligouense]